MSAGAVRARETIRRPSNRAIKRLLWVLRAINAVCTRENVSAEVAAQKILDEWTFDAPRAHHGRYNNGEFAPGGTT